MFVKRWCEFGFVVILEKETESQLMNSTIIREEAKELKEDLPPTNVELATPKGK